MKNNEDSEILKERIILEYNIMYGNNYKDMINYINNLLSYYQTGMLSNEKEYVRKLKK